MLVHLSHASLIDRSLLNGLNLIKNCSSTKTEVKTSEKAAGELFLFNSSSRTARLVVLAVLGRHVTGRLACFHYYRLSNQRTNWKAKCRGDGSSVSCKTTPNHRSVTLVDGPGLRRRLLLLRLKFPWQEIVFFDGSLSEQQLGLVLLEKTGSP